jgi:RimJ/RimL family protein N-acetyltransferase
MHSEGTTPLPPIDYRVVLSRNEVDIKSLAAISSLSNDAPQRLRESIDFFRQELRSLDPQRSFLVAAHAGSELVGFSRFALSPRLGTWWCRGLEVVPEWQRRGIGTRLLRFGLDHLAGRGVTEVRSSTSPGNLPSRLTHLKAGFRLLATSGMVFDVSRENHCIFGWNAPPDGAPAE